MSCPACGDTLAGVTPVTATIAVCPGCLRTVVMDAHVPTRLAVAADTVELDEAELGRLRMARKKARG